MTTSYEFTIDYDTKTVLVSSDTFMGRVVVTTITFDESPFSLQDALMKAANFVFRDVSRPPF